MSQLLATASVVRYSAQASRPRWPAISSTDKPRTKWVDALCINQLDVNEGNQQVSRMVDTYPRVQRVLAWLNSTIAAVSETCPTCVPSPMPMAPATSILWLPTTAARLLRTRLESCKTTSTLLIRRRGAGQDVARCSSDSASALVRATPRCRHLSQV